MILAIAEKPSVAQSIANVLGASSRKDGYLEGNNYIVSWCVGHLVGLADASSYDERFAKWRYSDLPIVPEEWLFEVPKDKQKQFKVLRDLMRDKRVTELVCATDAGREGMPTITLKSASGWTRTENRSQAKVTTIQKPMRKENACECKSDHGCNR